MGSEVKPVAGLADPVVLAGVVGNVVSVVGVVMLNKYLASVDKFDFMLLLSAFHFAFTSLGTRVLEKRGVYVYKAADMRKVLPVALGSLGSVAFMNLNLAYNSVGFYQLSKLSCIPVTLLLERAWYGRSASRAVKLSLLPILAGVGLATVTDVEVNLTGLVVAAAAVLCTVCAQIFTSRFQQELGCDALQLLHHTAPLITVGMLLMMPLFDDLTRLSAFELTRPVVVRIAVSCVMALAVNITNYLVLGKTDPLTYQVLGHFKTITILVLGFTLFAAPLIPKNLAGVALAMGGVIMYTEAKRKAAAGGSAAGRGGGGGGSANGGKAAHMGNGGADAHALEEGASSEVDMLISRNSPSKGI
ncbi:triose-phosphate transporter family-domain-containing protein [Tribonema minus]|uniref:Triose-phosphate transporter family-domain-containing protein n=1 Tax=Tribonema minus TaxID=303371 RepID=A0A835YJS4_9STRA|nr:triose-phosphate transporter family-domain-containing protein [Tribonema minus]